jgi:RNA 2',3'-cyclic 3'-phosphodiesterase
MRTFIAIDIPEEIKKKIVEIQEQLPEFNGKKIEYENLHLTLKFLGEVNENSIEEIKNKLNRVKLKSFEIEIKDIGMFSDRIVWLKMKNCGELQKEVDDKLESLFEKEKRFMGHLTIARIKEIKDRKKFSIGLKKIKVPEMNFSVKKFSLKESKLGRPKPVYEDIEIYSLN